MEVYIQNNSKTLLHAFDEFTKIYNIVCFEKINKIGFELSDYDVEDSFEVVSDSKSIKFIGENERAVLYSVYDYFEKAYGVKYFWDEDIYPKTKMPFITKNYKESPRFKYRGLRYFAHRSLYRFQAEHWGIDDWKKELDWLVKKKFNLFMLRLGNRNAFERTFPETVKHNEDEYINQQGFAERTPLRSAEDDIKLEKEINEYANTLGLIRPVDCGTMTHWYSQTPESFLKEYNPKFLSQSNFLYNEKHSLVWDIRNKREFDLYFKLTDAYCKEFGNNGLFHTIGLAERLFSANRNENLELKKYTYKAICERLRRDYPDSKLLIASWDFSMFWKSSEVKGLLNELDNEQCIIFDYTSDTKYRENNFTNWGVIGRFPYIFGIFHAYEPQNDIRGDLKLIHDRLEIAYNDENCLGMVTWQELSHGDGFMLEYVAQNSWRLNKSDFKEQIKDFCNNRFGSYGKIMSEVYLKMLPIFELAHWGGDRLHPEKNYFRDFSLGSLTDNYEMPLFAESITNERIKEFEASLKKFNKHRKIIKRELNIIADIYNLLDTEGAKREAFDIARTVISRYIHFTMIENALRLYNGDFNNCTVNWNKVIELTKLFTKLLGTHDDYSICITLDRMKSQGNINKRFVETTIKHNSDNIYCRTCAYELMKSVTLPEFEAIGNWIERCNRTKSLTHDKQLSSDIIKIHNDYLESDIYNNAPTEKDTVSALKNVIDLIN